MKKNDADIDVFRHCVACAIAGAFGLSNASCTMVTAIRILSGPRDAVIPCAYVVWRYTLVLRSKVGDYK